MGRQHHRRGGRQQLSDSLSHSHTSAPCTHAAVSPSYEDMERHLQLRQRERADVPYSNKDFTKPLLCITLLALLHLPHSLSLCCPGQKSRTEIKSDYNPVVQTELDNAKKESIASLPENQTCEELKHKRSCSSDNTDVVRTLHSLTCTMRNQGLSYTKQLVTSVLNSINCPCPVKPTKDPDVMSKRRRTPTRRRHCKAKKILSAMTECYQILNTMSDT
ncbi:uncharacterized protein [Thunnus thynnus]|uniref:uncharacterized protein n=1 Tax=Thunnus thynnus TaxID=8237 RepID=UPI003527F491